MCVVLFSPFQTERQKYEARRAENPKMNQLKLYKGLTIHSEPCWPKAGYILGVMMKKYRRRIMMVLKTKIEMAKPKERFQGQWNHRMCPLMRLSHLTQSSKKD